MEGINEKDIENYKPEKMVMSVPFIIKEFKEREYHLRKQLDDEKRKYQMNRESIYKEVENSRDDKDKKLFTNEKARDIETEIRLRKCLESVEIQHIIEELTKKLKEKELEIELHHSLLRGWQLRLRKEGKE